MVRDRLSELQRYLKVNNSGNDVVVIVEPSQIETEIILNLEKFAEIRQWIDTIRENSANMRKDISTAAFHYNDREIREKVEAKIEESLMLCRQIYAAIKNIQKEIEIESNNETNMVYRIKNLQFLLIKDHYLKSYQEHEAFVNHYEDKIKKLILKEAKTRSYSITEDEAETLLQNKNMSFFVGNILEETEQCQQKLRDIMERHSELEKLEKSLIEVRDLFVKISTLVMEQGELIQVVEYHAQQASQDVDKAEKQLEKARELKIKSLKKKTYILICLSVILVLLILILLFV